MGDISGEGGRVESGGAVDRLIHRGVRKVAGRYGIETQTHECINGCMDGICRHRHHTTYAFT